MSNQETKKGIVMKDAVKKILVIGISLLLITVTGRVLSMAYTGYQVKRASEGKDISISNMTKEQYIQQVKDNGGADYEVCAYNKLIDKYGVKETMKMDMRAAANEKDIDQRLFEEVKECL